MTLKEFRASKTAMSSHDFGALVSDARWIDEPPAPFLVYAKSYFIEVLDCGRYCLLLERELYCSGPGVELEDLELKLYVWASADLKNVAE